MSDKMKASGYVFVLSVIEPQVETPHEIIPGHWLQKATADQAKRIRSILERFITSEVSRPAYEYDCVAPAAAKADNQLFKRDPVALKYEPLKENDWRYWVIAFEGTNAELEDLRYGLALMEQDIKLGFLVLTTGWGGYIESLHTHFSDHDREERFPKSISREDLELASRCYSKLKSLSEEYKHIRRAFEWFDHLNSVPLASGLTIIGLFSVLESILTHAPRRTPRSDSLVQQFKRKMPHVRKRFVRDLDYARWFDQVEEGKLWSGLYDYRSRIVHDAVVHIPAWLAFLKDRLNVVHFLRETVRLLLILALEEPVFLTDVKER